MPAFICLPSAVRIEAIQPDEKMIALATANQNDVERCFKTVRQSSAATQRGIIRIYKDERSNYGLRQ
jgi:hypothetical protein